MPNSEDYGICTCTEYTANNCKHQIIRETEQKKLNPTILCELKAYEE